MIKYLWTYVKIVFRTAKLKEYQKSIVRESSCFNFDSIKNFTRICDASDQKVQRGAQRYSILLDKGMVTGPSFWLPKCDPEPQNSENMVTFQEFQDFKRNPSISLWISNNSIIFFFWEKLYVRRSRLSTSFFAQEPKTYHRLDRPNHSASPCQIWTQDSFNAKRVFKIRFPVLFLLFSKIILGNFPEFPKNLEFYIQIHDDSQKKSCFPENIIMFISDTYPKMSS